MSRTGTYDLAVVDVRLPDIEGIEVLRRMRPNSRNMKKIILTGYPNLENAIESITQGVDAYLLKPIEPAEFLKIIEGKLNDKEKEDAYIENTVRQRMTTAGAKSSKTGARRHHSTRVKK
jgi:DNA-binding response OmpR family regulator